MSTTRTCGSQHSVTSTVSATPVPNVADEHTDCRLPPEGLRTAFLARWNAPVPAAAASSRNERTSTRGTGASGSLVDLAVSRGPAGADATGPGRPATRWRQGGNQAQGECIRVTACELATVAPRRTVRRPRRRPHEGIQIDEHAELLPPPSRPLLRRPRSPYRGTAQTLAQVHSPRRGFPRFLLPPRATHAPHQGGSSGPSPVEHLALRPSPPVTSTSPDKFRPAGGSRRRGATLHTLDRLRGGRACQSHLRP